jgi:hypothetical protein
MKIFGFEDLILGNVKKPPSIQKMTAAFLGIGIAGKALQGKILSP